MPTLAMVRRGVSIRYTFRRTTMGRPLTPSVKRVPCLGIPSLPQAQVSVLTPLARCVNGLSSGRAYIVTEDFPTLMPTTIPTRVPTTIPTSAPTPIGTTYIMNAVPAAANNYLYASSVDISWDASVVGVGGPGRGEVYIYPASSQGWSQAALLTGSASAGWGSGVAFSSTSTSFIVGAGGANYGLGASSGVC